MHLQFKMLYKYAIFLSVTYVVFGRKQQYEQCGGKHYTGATQCVCGLQCFKKNDYFSKCLTSCPAGWACQNYLTSSTITSSLVIQSKWRQCGGIGWTGPTRCEAKLRCYGKDQYYSQCLKTCPKGWQCSSSTTTDSQITTVSNQNFPDCKFRFGIAYSSDPFDYSIIDYITVWLGWPNFNIYWHGAAVKKCADYNKTPVLYAYFIAFMAREIWGLQDCNVGTPNLCQKGSEFIRQYRDTIVGNYRNQAGEVANIIGGDATVVWLIEPDFWQYYGDNRQENNPLSGDYMRALFDDFVIAIKSQLPNAKISWDISAWLSEEAMKTWWSYFSSTPHIDFIHTSGGESQADSPNIKPNELTWSFMSSLTGKKIIADTGYGAGGGSTGHNNAFDDLNNLKTRINDGVISVTQNKATNNWSSVLNTLRSQLPSLCRRRY